MSFRLFNCLLLSLLCILSSCQFEPASDDSLFITATQAFDRGDFALAETLFDQLLQESKATGVTEEKTASALYHLGELYRLQGKLDKAERLFWRALPIWANTVGPTHPSMALGLTGLAYVYEARLEFHKAEPLVKQALKVRETEWGVDHPHILPSLQQYAALLKKMNRPDEANALMSREQTILAKHTDSKPDLKEGL